MGSSNILTYNQSLINAESDAEYTADASRTGGAAVDSLLPSALFNKLMGQTSMVSAALCQSLANKGYTISDANYTNLVAAMAAIRTQADVLPAMISVAYATSLVFDVSLSTGFDLVLSGDVSASSLVNFAPGQILVFIIAQDGAGGHAFSWPPQITGTAPVTATANAVTVEAFIVAQDSSVQPLFPEASGVTTQAGPVAGRNIGEVYQNASVKPLFVNVVVNCPAGAYAYAQTDADPSPSTVVAAAGTVAGSLGGSYTLSFIVLAGNYYTVVQHAGSPSLSTWVEWQ
jgi:hypothetical protein